jgi:hypothetical protein
MITALEVERRFAAMRAGYFRAEIADIRLARRSAATRWALRSGTRSAPTG